MEDLFWSPIIDPIRASVTAHSHSRGIDHIEHHFLTALVRIQTLATNKFLALKARAGGCFATLIAFKDVRVVAGQYADLIFAQIALAHCQHLALEIGRAAEIILICLRFFVQFHAPLLILQPTITNCFCAV